MKKLNDYQKDLVLNSVYDDQFAQGFDGEVQDYINEKFDNGRDLNYTNKDLENYIKQLKEKIKRTEKLMKPEYKPKPKKFCPDCGKVLKSVMIDINGRDLVEYEVCEPCHFGYPEWYL